MLASAFHRSSPQVIDKYLLLAVKEKLERIHPVKYCVPNVWEPVEHQWWFVRLLEEYLS